MTLAELILASVSIANQHAFEVDFQSQELFCMSRFLKTENAACLSIHIHILGKTTFRSSNNLRS